MNAVRLRASACALVLSTFFSIADAQSLQPFQQAALDKILATIDPAMRPMMRAQLAPTLAMLNEQQVSMMLESLAAESAPEAPEEPADEPPAASPEDLAYNRAQYEPMLRAAWQAGKAFDDFVAGKLAEHCPADGRFAVFGSGWRYGSIRLRRHGRRFRPTSTSRSRSSARLMRRRTDATTSTSRTFGSTSTRRPSSAASPRPAGSTPRSEKRSSRRPARTRAANAPPSGLRIEQSANAKAGAVRERLEALLTAQAPGGNNAVLVALLNGRPVANR